MEVLSQNGVFYSEALSATFSAPMTTASSFGMPEPVKKLQDQGKVAFWGDNNLFPNEVAADIRASSLLGPLIDWKAKKLYSEGLVYGNTEVDPKTGFERFIPMQEPEIEDWVERSNLPAQLIRGFRSFYAYENTFPMLQLSKRNGVAGLFWPDSLKCRLGTQNESTGLIDKAYIAADWSEVNGVDDSGVKDYTALNPNYDIAGQISASEEEFVIVPQRILDLGQTFYALAFWNGIRVSKWFEVAQSCVKWKLWFMKNSMSLRYHIEIHEDFWPMKFPDWEDKKELQAERKSDEVKAFNKWAIGEEKAGRTLMTAMQHRMHEKGNELYSLWKINVLKVELPSGAYIQDVNEADFQMARALGVPVSLIGMGPGKKMGAGSGSDQRIASTNYLIEVKSHGDQVLSIMPPISRANKWNDRLNKGRPIKWMMRSTYTATMDRFNQVSPTPNGDGAVQAN